MQKQNLVSFQSKHLTDLHKLLNGTSNGICIFIQICERFKFERENENEISKLDEIFA